MEGLAEKDFNAFLDKYLEEGTGDVNIYFQMSEEQQAVIQAIKKSIKRIKYKNNEDHSNQG